MEEDVYVQQLREVFNSCDERQIGFLDERGVSELCNKLQIEQYLNEILTNLAAKCNDREFGIQFHQFKEAFVEVLDGVYNTLEGEEEEREEEEREDKKEEECEKQDREGQQLSIEVYEGERNTKENRAKKKRQCGNFKECEEERAGEGGGGGGGRIDDAQDLCILEERIKRQETEGIWFLPIGILDQGNVSSEESVHEQVRLIWDELRVGIDGYLDMKELGVVCNHIGMEEMDDSDIDRLFNRLDKDKDGRVSFYEFLQGIYNRSRTESKIDLLPNDNASIFTELDNNKSGFAKSSEVIKHWKNLGIENGEKILNIFGVTTPTGDVNLKELSECLEQEMLTVVLSSDVYSAALASFKRELHHLRILLDDRENEKKHLEENLKLTNARLRHFLEESDERQFDMDNARKEQLKLLENKYEDQVKSLRNQMRREKNEKLASTYQQLAVAEDQLKDCRKSEKELKSQLSLCQKELKKADNDLKEVIVKCNNLKEENICQKEEIDLMLRAERELRESEQRRENSREEQIRLSKYKINELQKEKLALQDNIDELSIELAELKSQKNAQKQEKIYDSKLGNNRRTPTPISDTEFIDDDVNGTKRRRKLPARPSESEMKEIDQVKVELQKAVSDRDELQATVEELETEFAETIEKNHKLQIEVAALRQQLEDGDIDPKIGKLQELAIEQERKDLEHSYKMEVAEIEELRDREREEMEAKLEEERTRFEELLENKLKEKEEELQKVFANDLQDVRIRCESEKNLFVQKMNAEKEEELQKLRDENEKQKDSDNNQDIVDRLNKKIAELEIQLKLQREELELEFEQRKKAIIEEFEREKSDLEKVHRSKIYDYEQMFEQGPSVLKGKLKNDFEKMLNDYKEAERNKMKEEFDNETIELSKEFGKKLEDEQVRFTEELQEERIKLQENYDKENSALKAQLNEVKDSLDKTKDSSTLIQNLQTELQEKDDELLKLQQLQTKSREKEIENNERYFDLERQKNDLEKKYQELIDDSTREKNDLNVEIKRLECDIEDLKDKISNAQKEMNRQDDYVDNLKEFEKQLETRKKHEQENLNAAMKYRKEVDDLDFKLKDAEILLKQERSKIEDLEIELRDKNEMEKIQLKMKNEEESEKERLNSSKRFYAMDDTDKKKNSELMDEKNNLELSYVRLQERIGNLLNQNLSKELTKVQKENWEFERDRMSEQLNKTNEEMAEVRTIMSLRQSQNQREIQILKDKLDNSVDTLKYRNACNKLTEAEYKIRQLESRLNERSTHINNIITGTLNEHKKGILDLEDEKEKVKRQLDNTKEVLDDHVRKLQRQVYCSMVN
ncbi:DgyrCDS9852 [Dimorphilus gyrociliatus]|uniref:DgyrCDS9852 n=1 Tax=Dimorphilus gyrociliatus TaxID=2664684 RepID=A0A7I8VYA5_9ANNE|nr:DgyrCDS9852 [Dimorphilus gyrociliatus]